MPIANPGEPEPTFLALDNNDIFSDEMKLTKPAQVGHGEPFRYKDPRLILST